MEFSPSHDDHAAVIVLMKFFAIRSMIKLQLNLRQWNFVRHLAPYM